jgi:hypothetical protein
MNLGCSVSVGRNSSRTSATSSKRSSIPPALASFTTLSSIALSIIVRSYSPSLIRKVAKMGSRTATAAYTSYIAVRRLCSTWLHLKSMVLNLTRSLLIMSSPCGPSTDRVLGRKSAFLPAYLYSRISWMISRLLAIMARARLRSTSLRRATSTPL